MKIIDWLFERKPAGTKPQIGLAGANKRALVWLPGRKEASQSRVEWALKRSVLTGCSQLAVKSWKKPIEDSDLVHVCWIGLDIDQAVNLKQLEEALGENGQYATIRKSSGGVGTHVLFRLEAPWACSYDCANRVIKDMTKLIVGDLKAQNIEVCSADRRLFWLIGGECETVLQSNLFIPLPLIASLEESEIAPPDIREEIDTSGLKSDIKEWVVRLGLAGKVRVGQKNPVNIRGIVERLRGLGERVETRSPMTSTNGTNGFIDLTPNYIALWSFADGHTIWRYSSCDF